MNGKLHGKVKNLNNEVKDKINFYFCNRMSEHYNKEEDTIEPRF